MNKAFYLLILITTIGCTTTHHESQPEIYSNGKVAIDGYDVVAYFTESKALIGTKENLVELAGVNYYFASKENKLLFEEAPEKYLPSYGGWCAYAVAESSIKMAPEPTNWQIQDGELQFFVANWQTKLMGSLKDEWNLAPLDYKLRADDNWERIK